MRKLRCCVLLCGLALMPGIAGEAHAQSAVVCDGHARQYSQTASRQGQMLGTGAVGSLVGAGIGAAFGGPAVGAAVGGAIGLIGGGAKRNETANRMYNAAYQDCMARRAR